MRRINQIRAGLSGIPNSLLDFPPEPSFRGVEPGVTTTPIWTGDNYEALDKPQEAMMPEDSFSDSEEEDENEAGMPPDFDPVIEIGADVDETFPSLGGEAGEQIRRSILLHGMDALGWYVSFHVVGVQWGIFIPVTGIAYLIKNALSKLTATVNAKAHLAFHAILNHELFHFGTDYTIAQAELIHQEPWWVPAKAAFKGGMPNYCVIEEQLANAYMLKVFRTMKPALRIRGKQRALREFTKVQPEGYCDGWRVRSQDWDRLLPALAEEYGRRSTKGAANPRLWERDLGFDWTGQFPMRPRIDWRYCPIHLVNDGSRLGIPPDFLSFFARIPALVESERFLKRLRDMADSIQRAWERTKLKLAVAITRGADFKPWPNGGFGVHPVRLNDNYRAHIQRPNVGDAWTALDLGTHKEMGHG
jgi:hypothetical protein